VSAGESLIPFRDVPDDELTDEQIRQKYAPVCIGPTWKRDAAGGWLLPERTLGWEIAGWMAKWLGGPDGSDSFTMTLEQLRFVLWWYAVDEHGEFIYRTGVLQRLKGWGKDPLAAALCLVELVGPSRFSHFGADGKPVGKAHPAAFVQIAAVNQEQTQNTTTMFALLMTDRFMAEYRVEAGKELIYAMGGKVRLKAVTSSPRALEGGRSTFIILNETHHWIRGNNGIQMFETIDGNATKMDGRYLAITNAYMPGEDSVAERQRDQWDKIDEGRAADVGLLYDSLEAPEHTPLDPAILPTIIELVRGDAVWLKIDAIMKSVLSTTMSPARSRRMWLNQVVAEADSLFSPADWKVLEREGLELRPGDRIVLGFDGGKSDDATALVAIRVKDFFIKPLQVWEKPDGPAGDGWEVDRAEVDSMVRDAFRVYDVVAFYADVALWESYIDTWALDYGEKLAVKSTARNPIAWDMRRSEKETTHAHEAFVSAILNGQPVHDGDPLLRRHVMNVKRKVNNYGISFRKAHRESPRKIDAYAAAFLAFLARRDYLASSGKQRQRTGRGYFL